MNESNIDVIIIRGAPGVGKSTAAKKLAEYFPKGVRLEVDTLRSMVISVDWKDQAEHINLLYVSSKAVSEFLALGYRPVIVVDTFSGNKIERFLQDLLEGNKEPSAIIIGLHCSDDELLKRVNAREQGEFKDFEISKKLNSAIKKRGYTGEIKIDTTTISPEGTVSLVYEIIVDRHSRHDELQFLT